MSATVISIAAWLLARARRREQLDRLNRRARRSHRELIKRLGGECAICRARRRLQVDHCAPNGRGWPKRQLAFRDRVARYLREERAGVPLRALCIGCNSTDGAHRRWAKARAA